MCPTQNMMKIAFHIGGKEIDHSINGVYLEKNKTASLPQNT